MSAMDSAILSITHSSPHGDLVLGGGGERGASLPDLPLDSTPQRKITLLTRPPQPPVGSLGDGASANPTVSSIIAGEGVSLMSDVSQTAESTVLQVAPLPTPGRAARNDYYDTEDPSVNLHEFIINSLQAQKNRVVLLKLEEEFLTYVTDLKRVEPLKLPPWDSYHRMLAHRVAAYFGLEHNVDPIDKSCVVVCKGPQTRVPLHRFSDFLAMDTDTDSAEPKLILKRSGRGEAISLEKSFDALSSLSSDVKSFEQREEEYEKVRARIFSQQPLQGSRSSIAFDLGSAPQRTRSSLLPTIMQHRRTVSDTLLFRRPSAFEELKKDGPSSSHSSRSTTPLVALFRQPQEVGVGGQTSAQSQPIALQGVVTSQHSVQQQKLQQARETVTSQPLQQLQSRTQTKYPSQRPSNSFHYHSAHQRGVPVFYPQPATPTATTATIVTDPSWYYNNLLLYQVTPQQFMSPSSYGQIIQPAAVFPVNHQYPMAPGVVATPTPIVSSPVSTRPTPHGHGMRLPVMSPPGAGGFMENLPPSPSHTTGVTLVRPVAQVATPTLTQFKYASVPTTAVMHAPHAHGYSLHQPSNTVLTAQHARVVGGVGQPGVGPLSEQMEQLALGTAGGAGVRGEGGEVLRGVAQRAELPTGTAMPHKGGSHKLGGQSLIHGDARNGKSGVLNGSFFPAYTMMPGPGMEGMAGQMVSPTQVPSGLQFLHTHMQPHVMPGSPDPHLVSPQHVPPPGTPGGVLHYPGSLPSQSSSAPTTPPIGHMGFPPIQNMLSAQQSPGLFSPTTSGVAHSPIQILGHTLGTSLFSPPPSTTGHHHGMFVSSPSSGGKVLGYPPGSPAHAPVGSGMRFRRYDSPKQPLHSSEGHTSNAQTQGGGGGAHVQFRSENPIPQGQAHVKAAGSSNSGVALSGSSPFQPVQLPPRLANQQQQQQRSPSTRYQNQRHPANRMAAQQVAKGTGNPGLVLSDPTAASFVQVGGGAKKEALLPTPPTAQMVKLDTTLTCGVPLHVMEVITLPPEATPERTQALQILQELGAQEFKSGHINRTREEVLIATFPSPEIAIKALQTKHALFTLSLPRNNHAKFIMSLLQNSLAQ